MHAPADDDRSSRSGSEDSPNRSEKPDRWDGGNGAWMKALRDVSPYLDLGWRLAGTTAFPPLLGYALDVWLQTIPWFLFGGCVLGLTGAVLQLHRLQGELTQ